MYAQLIRFFLCIAIGAGATYYVMDLKMDAALATQRKPLDDQIAKLTLEASEAKNAQDAAMLDAKKKQDQDAVDHRATLMAAQKEANAKLKLATDETNRWRMCVAAGTCGVRLVAATTITTNTNGLPQAGSASSGDNGTGARLNAIAEQNYFALRDAIGGQRQQLILCQKYAAVVSGSQPPQDEAAISSAIGNRPDSGSQSPGESYPASVPYQMYPSGNTQALQVGALH